MSGISNPLEVMPQDIHQSMWARVEALILSGDVAVTKEIYDEMYHIPGQIGDCIRANEALLVLEVEQQGWDWQTYLAHATQLQGAYEHVISEFNGGRRNTIGLNDLSIIALGKTLDLPVVSMEAPPNQISETKKRIPEVCNLEGVTHFNFSDFLRTEGITI